MWQLHTSCNYQNAIGNSAYVVASSASNSEAVELPITNLNHPSSAIELSCFAPQGTESCFSPLFFPCPYKGTFTKHGMMSHQHPSIITPAAAAAARRGSYSLLPWFSSP